jgi:hypothetical protein
MTGLYFHKILSQTTVPNVSENTSYIIAAFLTNSWTQNDKKYSKMQSSVSFHKQLWLFTVRPFSMVTHSKNGA